MLANFLKVHDCLGNVGKLPQLGTIYRPNWELGNGGDEDDESDEDDKIMVEIEVPADDSDDDDYESKKKKKKKKKIMRKVKVPKQFEFKCTGCGLPNVSDYEWECECNGDDEPQNHYPPTKKTLKEIEDKLELAASRLGGRTIFAMKRVFTDDNILDFVHVNGEPLPKDPDTLWAMGKQSAYGDLKTMKTTFDTNVRNAREISLSKLSNPSSASDVIKSIELTEQAKKLLDESVREISEKMFGGQELGYQLNKINLYGPDGHFKEHIDTPRDGVVGSLVVRLPYLYDGGRFSIRFSTEETSGTALVRVAEDHSTYDKSISLIAFYCECPHKIDRVTNGMRVTATFYLTQQPASLSTSSSPIVSTSTPPTNESKEEKAETSSIISTAIISTDNSLEKCEEADLELAKVSLKRKTSFDKTDIVDSSDEDDAETSRKKSKSDLLDKWQYFKHQSSSVDNLRNSEPEELLKLVADYFACLKAIKEPSHPIGIFLSHSYSTEQFLAKTFKGADVDFMRKINDASNLSSEFAAFNIPVLILQSEGEDSNDSENNYHSTSVHSLLEIDSQDARDGSVKDDIIFFGKNWKEISRQYDPGAEHTGNESRDSLLMAKYFANAVIFVEKSDSNSENIANFTAFVKKVPQTQLVLD